MSKLSDIPLDTLEYSIYIDTPSPTTSQLDHYKSIITEFINSNTHDYIWNHEAFHVQPHITPVSSYLKGSTYYGDNIEDEWWIVYLLFQISVKYKEVTIGVRDADGQFLCIECAEYLPDWLNEKTSRNRIWIKHGTLHVIPIPKTPMQLVTIPTSIDVNSALKYMSSCCEKINNIAFSDCESITMINGVNFHLFSKFSSYPKSIYESNKFNANVILPIKTAILLNMYPKILSPAIDAFYLRTPTDMNKALKLNKLLPNFDQNTMVIQRLRFTRNGYAKIKMQKFHPPKHYKLPPVSSKLYEASELGMKLTCALEIFISKTHDNEEYNNIVEKFESSIANLSNEALYEKYIALGNMFGIDSWDTIEPSDSEDWLNISENKFNEMLSNYGETNSDDKDIPDIVNNLKSFVNSKSDISGVKSKTDFNPEEEDIQFSEDVLFNELKSSFSSMTYEDIDKFSKNLPPKVASMLLEAKTQGLLNLNEDEEESEEEEIDIDFEDDEELTDINNQVEKELLSTKALSGFERYEKDEKSNNDENLPINLDYNLIKNVLESYEAQNGDTGPISNLLASMGMKLK